MTENDKQEITLSAKETRIAPWGDRNEIREIARRVQLMAPGAKKLNETEALALAQGAVAHGLDPFNGEIWFIPGSGLMAGIKGLRKAARQQLDGNFWTEFNEITDPDERALLMIPEGALAYKCLVRDSETIRTYSDGWKDLNDAGVPVEIIPDLIGRKPYTQGIGYLKKGESTKMDPAQVAMKRAEADALKRRFDLPFAIPSQPNDMPIIIDGEWVEATGEDDDLGKRAAEGSTTLYGEDERPRSSEILKKFLVEKSLDMKAKGLTRIEQTQRGKMVGVLNRIFAGPNADEDRHALCKGIFDEASSKKLKAYQVGAINYWLDTKKDSGGEYVPDHMSVTEAVAFVDHLVETEQYDREAVDEK